MCIHVETLRKPMEDVILQSGGGDNAVVAEKLPIHDAAAFEMLI